MAERELEGTGTHRVRGLTRRVVTGVLAGCGLASVLGNAADAKKKRKKNGKKKGKSSPKPTPPTCKSTCSNRTCGDSGCGGSCGTCGAGTICEDGRCLAPNSYEFEREWGSWGSSGASKFDSPWGIAVDDDANVYVADSNNDRVQKFSSAGQYITEWGGSGTIDGMFDAPAGVASGPSGQIYVADSLNHRVQRFTNAGGHIQSWATMGSEPGQLLIPWGIAENPVNGNVYVTVGDRLQVFNGSALGQTIFLTYQGNSVNARAVTVSYTGRILYVSRDLGLVFAIDAESGDVMTFGALGSGNGQFRDPSDVAVDAVGNIFVADRGNHRVQILSEDGDFITSFGGEGSGPGQFRNPIGLDVDSSGNVYVTDLSNNRVQKFRPVSSRPGR